VLLRLAKAAIAMGDATRAADLAESLLSRGDAADGHQVLGDAYYLNREQIASVAEWHKALDADPGHVNALLSLADFSADRQNYEAAEQYLQRALKTRPEDPDLLFHHGRALYYLKRYKESEADLAKALARKGESGVPLALYYLGLIQKEKRNVTGAAEFLRRYLQWAYAQGRLTAVEAEVHLALAEVYRAMNLADLAEQQKRAGEVLQEKLKEMAKVKEKALVEWLKKP
jgi:Tfp pilus assembly protein PilF